MISHPAAMTRRELAAAREAILAPQRLAAAEHCWVYWHTAGRAPVRCTVRPDHHDGSLDYGIDEIDRRDQRRTS